MTPWLWLFISFSYHLDKGLSVGIIKIGANKVIHAPNYLKFYIGSNYSNHLSFNT